MIKEFSLSGRRDDIFSRFGNPPKLPEDTINPFHNYNDFLKFVGEAKDYAGRTRKFDSEIKYVYNFLRNHIDKGDEFIIETTNIFKTCGSGSREFIILEKYLKTQGKKVKFIINSDSKIEGFSKLLKENAMIKSSMKDYEKLYKQFKKSK